ncbi:MAG: flippase [Candidatus Aenigmarchaeota archaeon]|nr:flippase [Candidatus Aenigmarchaeota archaeon]
MSSETKKRIVRNALYNNLSSFVSKFAAIAFTMVLARLMNPEMFGVYFLALSVASVVLTFSDLGVGGALQRYVSNSLGKNDKALARSYSRYILRIKIVLVMAGTSSLFFLSGPLSSFVFSKPELTLPLQIVSFYVFFEAVSELMIHYFVSVQEFKYKVLKTVFFQVFRFIFVPLLVIFGFGAEGALAGTVLTLVLVTFILAFLLFRKHLYLFRGPVKSIPRRKLFTFISYTTVYMVSAALYFSIDTLMIGALLPIEDAGYYRAAITIVSAFIGVVSIYQVVFPLFSQQTGDNLRRTLRESFRYISILSFPLPFILALFGEQAIKVLYTPEYIPAALPLAILSLLVIETIGSDLFTTLLVSQEKPQIPAYIMIFSMSLNCILNYVFIINFGILGAAFATVVSRYANTLLLGISLKRALNITPAFSSIAKPLFSSLIMFAFLWMLPAPHEIIIGIGEIIAGVLVYLTVMFAIKGISKKDFDIVLSVFK